MSESFKIGDTVRLKSGGPVMTVTEVGTDYGGDEQVWCVWFDDKKAKQQDHFPPAALQSD